MELHSELQIYDIDRSRIVLVGGRDGKEAEVCERNLVFLGLIFIFMAVETKRRGGFFAVVTQWFVRGQDGVLKVILPLSLGCRDPII